MRQALDRDRFDERVGKNDLLAAQRGGIALESGLDIRA